MCKFVGWFCIFVLWWLFSLSPSLSLSLSPFLSLSLLTIRTFFPVLLHAWWMSLFQFIWVQIWTIWHMCVDGRLLYLCRLAFESNSETYGSYRIGKYPIIYMKYSVQLQVHTFWDIHIWVCVFKRCMWHLAIAVGTVVIKFWTQEPHQLAAPKAQEKWTKEWNIHTILSFAWSEKYYYVEHTIYIWHGIFACRDGMGSIKFVGAYAVCTHD